MEGYSPTTAEFWVIVKDGREHSADCQAKPSGEIIQNDFWSMVGDFSMIPL